MRPSPRTRPWLALALLASAVAGTMASTPASGCPFTDLKRGSATFITARGRFTYRMELALNAEQQACGLMFRPSMPRDAGMAFPMVPPRVASFWMQNTILPLDIIYVSPRGRVLNIVQGRPYDPTPLSATGLTGEVIELNAGEAERIGLKPGDRVTRK
jgi:uncharacterized membrane protein (UPF0127 family)